LVDPGAVPEHGLSKQNFSKNMKKTSHFFVFSQNPLDLDTNAIELWVQQAFLYIQNNPFSEHLVYVDCCGIF
jgi:hypothetical protein